MSIGAVCGGLVMTVTHASGLIGLPCFFLPGVLILIPVERVLGPSPLMQSTLLLILINLFVYSIIGGFAGAVFWNRKCQSDPLKCRCGYLLIGNVSGCCPECGREIDRNV